MRMAPLLNRHYDKTQSAAVNRHLEIQAGMLAPSESAGPDPPPIQDLNPSVNLNPQT